MGIRADFFRKSYFLKSDPLELTDLAETRPEEVQLLAIQSAAWKAE